MWDWDDRSSRFAVDSDAVERLRQFIASPERRTPVDNINRYWLTRRMNLDFVLEPDAITILKDSNLKSRITAFDHKRICELPSVSDRVLKTLRWVLDHSGRWILRAERFLELQRIGKELKLAQSLSDDLAKRIFPFGSWIEKQIRSAPISFMLDGWPQRTLLMLHAVDVIQHFAPSPAPVWRVLEIGSGPAMVAGLMMEAYGSRHVLIDLPEQIAVGFSLLSEFWPHKRILLPHEVIDVRHASNDYDTIFLTPGQLPLLGDRCFDIAVNMFSFQEMSSETIREYFSLIRQRLVTGGVFYCANRITKPNPHDGTMSEFASYPWHPKDEFLFDQDMRGVPGASRIHRECLVHLDCLGNTQQTA
jgi:hypothetical protein